MYNVLIGDDPQAWHWSVYWNLPLVPLYLMATHATSRMLRSSLSISNLSLPVIFWLGFPSSSVSISSSNLMPVSVLAGMHSDTLDLLSHHPSNRLTLSYPPSPALCLLALPFLRVAYVTLRRRFVRWVLQIPPNEPLDLAHLGGGDFGNAAAAGDRRQVWVIGGDDDDVDVERDMDAEMDADGDVGIGADIRIDVDIDRAGREDQQQEQQEGQQQQQPNQNQNVNPDVAPVQVAQQAEPQINGDQQPANQPNQPQANQPPRRVRLTFSSFGRFLTKVLLTPWIASYSGRVLELISRKWGLMRRILAINDGPVYYINGRPSGVGIGAGSSMSPFKAVMSWIGSVAQRKEEVKQISRQGLGLGQSLWKGSTVEPIW